MVQRVQLGVPLSQQVKSLLIVDVHRLDSEALVAHDIVPHHHLDARSSVDLKSAIEQLREQVQNIE